MIREQFYAKNRSKWRNWLQKNHASRQNIWLVLHKKGSPKPGILYAEAVEEALCFGWIDSKPQKRDAHSFLMYFAVRKPRSVWSKINKERIKRMISEGLMTHAGMVKINAAKKDGSWSTLDSVDALEIPAELRKAFTKNKKGLKNFEKFPPSVKKQLYYWVNSAKQPATHAARIKEIVSKAAKNERANQWKPKSLV